jgi:hypothetical protein
MIVIRVTADSPAELEYAVSTLNDELGATDIMDLGASNNQENTWIFEWEPDESEIDAILD